MAPPQVTFASHAMSQNQTLSFLMRRFAEVGIRPRSKHGQNFLIDLNLLRLLVEAAAIRPQRRDPRSRHWDRLADGIARRPGGRSRHRSKSIRKCTCWPAKS